MPWVKALTRKRSKYVVAADVSPRELKKKQYAPTHVGGYILLGARTAESASIRADKSCPRSYFYFIGSRA